MSSVTIQANLTKGSAAKILGEHIGAAAAARGFLPMDFPTVWTQMAYTVDVHSPVGAAYAFLANDNSTRTRNMVFAAARTAYDAAKVAA